MTRYSVHDFVGIAIALGFLLAESASLCANAENWPQWQGPNRDNKSSETGLLKSWPAGGPRRLWMNTDCGVGFGGPAIVDGRLYVLGGRNGVDYLLCLDANQGTEIWHAALGETLKNDWSDGSRGRRRCPAATSMP